MSTSHKCSVPGCREVIPSLRLMCRPHWRLVSKPVQRQVWIAWDRYQSGQLDLAGLRKVQDVATASVMKRKAADLFEHVRQAMGKRGSS